MTWGQLGEAIATTPQPAAPVLVPGYPVAELAQVMDQHIAWHEAGMGGDPLGLPPLFSVVRLIAGHITQLPMTVNGGSAPRWLRQPQSRGSVLDLQDTLQYLVTSMALSGAGYLWVRKAAGQAWDISVIHPSSVGVQAEWTGRGLQLRFALNGRPITAPPWQVREGDEHLLHIPYLVTPNHPAGCSPVTVARESLYGYGRVESQAADLLDRGTYSGGRLETDQDITAETGRRYQESWVKNRKTGAIPVLGAGLRYVNDLLSPKDAMWLESRAFNAQQIAMMFGVPPDLLGMTMQGGGSSLAYNNAQDNNRRYLRNALMAFTTQLGAGLSRLLPHGRTEAEDQSIEFDYSDFIGGVGGAEDQAEA